MSARALAPVLGTIFIAAAMTLSAAEKVRVGVWLERSFPRAAAADPAALIAALDKAGFDAASLSTADLTNSARLDPSKLPLLVLPCAGSYPVYGLDALESYLRNGGGCILFGADRFNNPLFPEGDFWHGLSSGKPQTTRIPAVTWDLRNHGEGPALRVTGEGSADRPFRFEAGEVKTYMYGGMTPGPLPEPGALIIFEARSLHGTPLLCLELHEADRSRWKQVVSLSSDWLEYRLHTASFSPYASPGRTNDYFRPSKARMLYFGLIRAMAGTGAHGFELRNLKFQEANVASRLVHEAPVPLPGKDLVKQFFGDQVPALPSKRWPACLEDGARFENTSIRTTGHPICAGLSLNAFSINGRLLAQNPPLRLDSAGEKILLFPEAPTAPRVIPLMDAFDADRGKLGVAAAMVVHREGPYAGARWAVFGIDKFPANNAALDLFVRAVRYITSGVVIGATEPVFSIRNGRPEVQFSQPLRNRTHSPVSLELTSSFTQTAKTGVARNPIETNTPLILPVGKTLTTNWYSRPVEGFDWRHYRAETEISVGDLVLDQTTYTVDVRQALRDLSDFLVTRSVAAKGKFSGTHYYIDHRGARTLLAAYEIFGDERYRVTAIRWAQAMIAEQRSDGGYRMGYGVGTRGEACFVADGGEIALGVARAACYATGTERQALLDSVRAYMRYRDSFRVPGGGIGVGWSFTDYGQRPTVKLSEPRKIFAPEMNTYTIGCTLGAAYLYATLTGRLEDFEAARADADWFMARSKSASGATAESFVLAHFLETDPLQRRRYEEYLRERFLQHATTSRSHWWLLRGGRACLDAHAMSYCTRQLGPDPLLDFQMARAASAMFSKESPTSIYKLMEKPKLNHDEWIFLCFGGISLAEMAEPLVTFKRLNQS